MIPFSSHAAISNKTNATHPENSDEDATMEDIDAETAFSADSNKDDNTYYATFEAFTTTLLVKVLDLPPPGSVSLICKGGYHYPFVIEYPTSLWIRSHERC